MERPLLCGPGDRQRQQPVRGLGRRPCLRHHRRGRRQGCAARHHDLYHQRTAHGSQRLLYPGAALCRRRQGEHDHQRHIRQPCLQPHRRRGDVHLPRPYRAERQPHQRQRRRHLCGGVAQPDQRQHPEQHDSVGQRRRHLCWRGCYLDQYHRAKQYCHGILLRRRRECPEWRGDHRVAVPEQPGHVGRRPLRGQRWLYDHQQPVCQQHRQRQPQFQGRRRLCAGRTRHDHREPVPGQRVAFGRRRGLPVERLDGQRHPVCRQLGQRQRRRHYPGHGQRAERDQQPVCRQHGGSCRGGGHVRRAERRERWQLPVCDDRRKFGAEQQRRGLLQYQLEHQEQHHHQSCDRLHTLRERRLCYLRLQPVLQHKHDGCNHRHAQPHRRKPAAVQPGGGQLPAGRGQPGHRRGHRHGGRDDRPGRQPARESPHDGRLRGRLLPLRCQPDQPGTEQRCAFARFRRQDHALHGAGHGRGGEPGPHPHGLQPGGGHHGRWAGSGLGCGVAAYRPDCRRQCHHHQRHRHRHGDSQALRAHGHSLRGGPRRPRPEQRAAHAGLRTRHHQLYVDRRAQPPDQRHRDANRRRQHGLDHSERRRRGFRRPVRPDCPGRGRKRDHHDRHRRQRRGSQELHDHACAPALQRCGPHQPGLDLWRAHAVLYQQHDELRRRRGERRHQHCGHPHRP